MTTELTLGQVAGLSSVSFELDCAAVYMANACGARDNAKKYVEANIEPELGGKRSERHKATVVGDPFKDATGPSLDVIVKLMSMVSVVAAGFIVAFGGWF